MHLLPSFEFALHSVRTPEDIRIILSSVTVVPKKRSISLFGPTGGDFVGQVFDSGFELVPILGYNNSFNPIIRGWMEENEEGTKIYVTMRMHKFVSGFSVFWFGGVSFFFLIGVFLVFTEGLIPALSLVLTSVAMFVFGQLTMRFAFYKPAKQSKQRIMELIGGKDI